jgi:hypothetical protein
METFIIGITKLIQNPLADPFGLESMASMRDAVDAMKAWWLD